MKRGPLVALALLAMLAAACDDGDADPPGDTSTPTSAPSTSPAETTAPTAPTTTPTTRPPTTAPTTVPSPTTSPEDALKAQIAADYLRSVDRYFELVNRPSLDNLAERAKLAAADGSEYYAAVVAQVEQLVELGDRIIPNDPDIRRVTVESVSLVGDGPYTEALVTVCAVTNAKQITPAENSAVGQEIITFGTGELIAVRRQEPVSQTAAGWLPTAATVDAIGVWEGSDQCGPR